MAFVQKGTTNCESAGELNQTESKHSFPDTVTLSNFGGYHDVVNTTWDILWRGLEVRDSHYQTSGSRGGLSELSIFTPPRGMLIFGPPGVGKSKLISALLKIAPVAVESISHSILLSRYLSKKFAWD